MQLPFTSKSATDNVPNTRSQRVKCWESRDKFFQCLDKIDVIDSLNPQTQQKVKENCSNEYNEFNTQCINSWIKYFQKKRVTDWEKQHYVMAIDKDKNRIDP